MFIVSLIVTNCSFKKVVKHHGVSFLEKKQKNLIINKTNKNEIINLLGNPSTKSKFNNDVWIYIERKQTQSRLINLGKMKIYKNDVLVLEIDNYGLLKKKDFYNLNDMKKINIVKNVTEGNLSKNSFIYEFMSSMRQKMSDPLGVRAKKGKKLTSDNCK